jgi:hypothetical protein
MLGHKGCHPGQPRSGLIRDLGQTRNEIPAQGRDDIRFYSQCAIGSRASISS